MGYHLLFVSLPPVGRESAAENFGDKTDRLDRTLGYMLNDDREWISTLLLASTF